MTEPDEHVNEFDEHVTESDEHVTESDEHVNEFDERAATWDDDPAKWRRAEDVAAAIRRRVELTPATAVLDYGCGTGLLGFALRHDVGTIDLADSSQGMLDAVAAKVAAAPVPPGCVPCGTTSSPTRCRRPATTSSSRR